MNRSRPMVLLALAMATGLALAACGTTTTATPTPTAAETPADGGDGGAGTIVIISGSTFGDDVTVPAGSTVTFVNEDSFGHTVTEGTDGRPADNARFDEQVSGGASVEVTFDEAGTTNVTCKIHSSMNMTVTVE